MLAYYPYSNKDPDPGTDTVLKKQHNVPASFQVAIFPRFSQSKNISSFFVAIFYLLDPEPGGLPYCGSRTRFKAVLQSRSRHFFCWPGPRAGAAF